jgi:hypothetical protein
MFPPIEFHPLYSDFDKRLYTFLIHSAIREFGRILKPWPAFVAHPVAIIEVTPNAFEECNCLGLTKFFTDEIKLRLPVRPGVLEVSATSDSITHELAHHLIEEYFDDKKAGVNLVHWEANRRDQRYRYTRTFASIVFARKYLLPWCKVPFPNLRLLISHKDEITQSVVQGMAPHGIHEYWK